MPTVALGVYAVAISYGYRVIGAAAGTFVFYAAVMVTLVGSDLVRRTPVPPRRRLGAVVKGYDVRSAAAEPPPPLRPAPPCVCPCSSTRAT